jgi:Lon protease-like protein
MNVYLFPLPNALTLPKITLPFHIFEPRYRTMIQDAVSEDIPVAVVPMRRDGDYQSQVFCGGIPRMLTKHGDGRMDITITGEIKGKLGRVVSDHPYLAHTYQPLYETHKLTNKSQFARECLLDGLVTWVKSQPLPSDQVKAFEIAMDDPEMLIGNATLFLLNDSRVRQHVLEESSLDEKLLLLMREWAPKEIDLGPFLSPIRND